MEQAARHTLWRYSRYNPRYSVAARIPSRNLRCGLRDLASWRPVKFVGGFAFWAASNVAWMLLLGTLSLS